MSVKYKFEHLHQSQTSSLGTFVEFEDSPQTFQVVNDEFEDSRIIRWWRNVELPAEVVISTK